MQSPLDRAVVLITGASSGIGVEIAKQLAGRASALVLVARRADRLSALAGELTAKHPSLRVLVKPCDVTDLAATETMVAEAEKEAGPIDVLVNNAGMGDFGVFDKASWDKTRRMIDLNVTAPSFLTHRLAPGMVERGRGGILNVSSGFGFHFLPGFSAYSGTKHYVTAFTEVLRLDLRGTGVVVSQVCPGPVATEFEAQTSDFEVPKVPAIFEISAARCARAALRGLERGRALVVPGILIWIVMTLGAMTPRFFRRWLFALPATRVRRMQLEAKRKSPGDE